MSAIISDGSQEITLTDVSEKFIYNVDKSVRYSVGGSIKAQVSGRRFKCTVEARVTGAIYKEVYEMLTNQAIAYYYTPDNLKTIYSGLTTPIQVDITLLDPTYDSGDILYMRFDVEGVGYI